MPMPTLNKEKCDYIKFSPNNYPDFADVRFISDTNIFNIIFY